MTKFQFKMREQGQKGQKLSSRAGMEKHREEETMSTQNQKAESTGTKVMATGQISEERGGGGEGQGAPQEADPEAERERITPDKIKLDIEDLLGKERIEILLNRAERTIAEKRRRLGGTEEPQKGGLYHQLRPQLIRQVQKTRAGVKRH